MAQGSCKWIMVYQDHLTKFCILRLVSLKHAAEVAHHLTDIFILFGALYILQSDNGSEFTAEVISEVKIIWPKLVLVHGKPRHPQSQGSVERVNGDIKDMLVAWIGDNNTTDWSTEIKFIQFLKNSSLHVDIRRLPYAAMFECEAKVGLTWRQCEDDVLAVLTTGQNGEEPSPVPSAESAEVHFENIAQFTTNME
ncbi:KRAB-A domain-containing protein 2-like [Penaeus indicus]|uniref:KRAB-A domain-containing protein 2-like n=1 Tax=Penaeus indicus TaxID=29960 RepID=UPI00300CF21D